MGFRTINLKLHKPSRNKRRIMDKALMDYTKGFYFLLEKASLDLQNIENAYVNKTGEYRALVISKWVNKEISQELNKFDVQPFKDSLKQDFGMAMASYLKLKYLKYKVTFPSRNIETATDLRPILFCRYDTKRDYSLLYDPEKNKYYAKLYLLNNEFAVRKSIDSNVKNKLIYLSKEKSAVEAQQKERFIIVPLSFGQWQENILKSALNKQEILKTAKLFKKNNEYFLSINIETVDDEKVETNCFMGISRGIKNPLNITMADSNNKIINIDITLFNEQLKAYGDNVFEQQLHILANNIVEKASKNKAQIVMADLVYKSDVLLYQDTKKQYSKPYLKRSTYNYLYHLLQYKLPAKGLPLPIRVSPIGIFSTCPKCGLNSKKNRISEDLFICIRCGEILDVENIGSLNLARKIPRYKHDGILIKVKKTLEGNYFTNKNLELNFCTRNFKDEMSALRNEIYRIIQDTKCYEEANAYSKEYKQKLSIIKKLEKNEDFMEGFIFI